MPESLKSLSKEITSCRACPRLVEYREAVSKQKRAAYKDWDYWGKPLAGFGDAKARLLIVGLAPAAHGGNRTGRIFTGDSSGTFLMKGLHKFGFATLPDSISADDGLELVDAFINAVARCAPPDNKPLPSEILNCRGFLLREQALLQNVRATLVLGKIAMDGYLQALRSQGHKIEKLEFAHGKSYTLPDSLPHLFVSYHVSRQNTQTGKLTEKMFADVLSNIRTFLDNKK